MSGINLDSKTVQLIESILQNVIQFVPGLVVSAKTAIDAIGTKGSLSPEQMAAIDAALEASHTHLQEALKPKA